VNTADLKGDARADFVRSMFARIAPQYDLMNRLMTAGQDVRWRREVIRKVSLKPQARILDLGAGTGDLAFETLKQQPTCVPFASDFTLEMIHKGKLRPNAERLTWAAGDATQLPFESETVDAVVSGFLLRNVVNIRRALEEQHRVLKPGGMMVALDTTRPRPGPLAPLVRFHMHTVIPALGKLIARDREAYTYLPDSSEQFLLAEQLAALMVRTGFQEVGFRRYMFGSIAIHWGRK
jgi:demethylmenaquinone methyltransferase/2-methoxy-6-polyprenyl-1,4-benzoquinol methylase